MVLSDASTTNTIIAVISTILFISFIIWFFRRERFENFAPLEIEVLPQYKDITPTQLYALFDNNLDKMTSAIIKSNIPTGALKTPSYYPKIASILAKNKLI